MGVLQVFESLREYKVQGSGVLFNANGQSALEAINPDLLERWFQTELNDACIDSMRSMQT